MVINHVFAVRLSLSLCSCLIEHYRHSPSRERERSIDIDGVKAVNSFQFDIQEATIKEISRSDQTHRLQVVDQKCRHQLPAAIQQQLEGW